MFHGSLYAQDFRIDQSSSITACRGNFYDSGGAIGFYQPNENYSTTICSNGSLGSHIKLLFREVDLYREDQLCIFDGNSINAPLLACATDFTTILNSDIVGISPREPIAVQASASNPTGCLTISFTSNGMNQREGWRAEISCIPACQKIEAFITGSTPIVQPVDTGWIDACLGQRIFLSADGNFPNEGSFYNHRDSAQYIWDFGDGTIRYGKNVDHTYRTSGGYNVILQIQDQLGCVNANFAGQRVRISTLPTFKLSSASLPTICSGDTVTLEASINQSNVNAIIDVSPNEGTFLAQRIRSDSLPLPDGTGERYTTSVKFTNFAPGQTLQDVNDLRGICVNMEHSFMRDLEIRLSCPNGQSIILHEYPGRTGARSIFLGEPITNDELSIRPGKGYDYCWTPNATNPTWVRFTDGNTISTLPSGDYSAFQPLSNLVGCPLNGDWTISVFDQWVFDNGYIFSWGIEFNPNLYPNIETFTPQITDYQWITNPTVLPSNDNNTLVASPINAGQASYIFSITDDFGCTYDTSVAFQVLPITHPNCYECQSFLTPLQDTTICDGQTISLDSGPQFFIQEVGFSAFPRYNKLGFLNHPPSRAYESSIEVTDVYPGIILNPQEDIVSVCIDIETAPTDWVSDLNIYLRAPNGSILPLSRGNGADGSNYTNTCFTPRATVRIQDGAAPFTGDFIPEGNWNNLTGLSTNGKWTLRVDDTNGPQLGTFNSWSITFNSKNGINYNWTPAEGLSCTDCPNPTASPINTTTYAVRSLDVFNCNFEQSVTINSASDYVAPTINCEITDLRQITFTWDDPSGVQNYEISLNGGIDWERPNRGNLAHALNNLRFREQVNISIRPLVADNPENCTIRAVESSCVYDACGVSILPTNLPNSTSCFGLADGVLRYNVTNGIAPFNFSLDGQTTFTSSSTAGILENLTGGNHQLIIIDANQCTDTFNFVINTPLPITTAANIQNVSCKNGNNGSITVTPSGGTGALKLTWANSSTNRQINNLSVGTYNLRITDANNCSLDTAFTITEPNLLVLSLSFGAASCSEAFDGTATAVGSGGTGTLSYQWNNGATTSNLSSLAPGIYAATVTDDNGCTTTTSGEVRSPEPLSIRDVNITNVDCAGNNTGRAEVSVTGGTTPYQYLWNDALGQTASAATLLRAGVYEVVITDNNGCTTREVITITEPSALTLAIDQTNVNCFGGEDGTASASVSGGVAPYRYEWNDGTRQTTQTAIRLVAGNYTAAITDANNCITRRDFEITQPENPITARIEQTFTGCHGLSQNEASVTAQGGTGPNYTYVWSNGQTSAIATRLDTLTYSVTVTDQRGCTANFQSGKIVDHPAFNIIINSTLPSCFGSTNGAIGATVRRGGTGQGYTYLWNDPAASTTPLVQNVAGGTTYTIIVTDSQGCTATKSSLLPQPNPITFETGTTNVRCNGGADGTASVTNVTGGNDNYRFAWDDKVGNATTAIVEGLTAGIYNVTVSDEVGCFSEKQIQVTEPTPLAVIFQSKPTLCNGSVDGAASVNVNGGIPSYRFLWSNDAVTSKIDRLTAGTYTLTVTDANNCELVSTVAVVEPAPIRINITPQPPTCAGSRDGRLDMNVTGGTMPYTFSLDDKNYRATPTFLALTAKNYNIFVQDRHGCKTTTTYQLIDPPAFTVSIFPNQANVEITEGERVQLFAEAINQTGKVNFVWSPSFQDESLSCTECFNPVATPKNTIFYELYGVDEAGCESIDKIQIRVNKSRVVLVPTGFTPNGDNLNNKLLVHGTEGAMIKLFRVHDRWGELLFENGDFLTNDTEAGWDGTFRGKEMPAGVYVWYLEVEYNDGRKELLKGSTMLIR
jgi:gliding motility-associated-like protein